MSTVKQLPPPNLTDILFQHKREIMTELNCVQIGIIQSFDSAEQTATIQLALKQVKEVKDDGTRILQEFPVLLKCPVMVLSGGAAFLSMPIAQGDTCIVLFNDREIDNWFVNGGIQTPSSFRAHDLSDGIAIVGIRNLQNAIASYLANGIRLAYGTTSKMDLINGAINTLAALFTHEGDMTINGALSVTGNADIQGVLTAATIEAGNGATGSFNTVTVVNGIVTGGT